MNIHDSIFETIEAHNLISTQDRLLVAVSGGIDSTVICHVLQDLGYQFDIAHVNFKLRGQASIHDFQFVEKLAQWFRCEFHATQVETKSYARDNKLTTQEAARIIRYDYFQKLVSEQHYDKVITAHHAGDNMETMLYNFIKGGTLSALRGIPLRRDYIIRPMLHTSKELIVQFAQHRQLSFCNDASNEDSKYSRNYIRKEIIPKLLILNPSLESTLNRTSHMGAGYESLIEQQIEAFKTNHVLQSENRLEVSLEELKSYASPLIILYHLAKSYGFSYINVEDIWTRYLNGNGTGKFFKNDQCRAVI
ncbi:MAG: tRNA lysidine(34) synthetase TilS, partial [Bacteroidia bacterium]|nr:tRNA lysidine(34) synthetase TilS [Bacteroidia bacterium]